jgi:hypothetical protein
VNATSCTNCVGDRRAGVLGPHTRQTCISHSHTIDTVAEALTKLCTHTHNHTSLQHTPHDHESTNTSKMLVQGYVLLRHGELPTRERCSLTAPHPPTRLRPVNLASVVSGPSLNMFIIRLTQTHSFSPDSSILRPLTFRVNWGCHRLALLCPPPPPPPPPAGVLLLSHKGPFFPLACWRTTNDKTVD